MFELDVILEVDGEKSFISFREAAMRLGKMEEVEMFLRKHTFHLKRSVHSWSTVAELLDQEIILFQEKNIKANAPLSLKIHPELIPVERRSSCEWRPMFKVYPNIKVKHLHHNHPDFGTLREVKDGELVVISHFYFPK